ncbi:MAG: pentapeptide repeat-containing protein [Vampirovibrio sp.]|nr:pentapeptide repeat-containing protein [Vampirovibrio sp.]
MLIAFEAGLSYLFFCYEELVTYLVFLYTNLTVIYNLLRKHIVFIAISALVILFLVTFIFVVQHIIPSFNMAQLVQTELSKTFNSDLPFKDYTTAQMDYVKGVFTLIAGLVGILVLMKSFFALDLDREKAQHELDKAEQAKIEADRKHDLEETKAQNERFAKAIEHLGNDAIDIRLGGIFALEALMNENPEHFASRVITQLCAYSSNRGGQLNALWKQTEREKIRIQEDNEEKERRIEFNCVNPKDYSPNEELRSLSTTLYELLKPPSLPPFSDLEAAAQIFCRTPHFQFHYKQQLHLINLFGSEFNLNNSSNLVNANLKEANLEKCKLKWSNLTGAILTNANLIEANLKWTNLTNVDLTNSDLTRANLERTQLTKGNLYGAILKSAQLAKANLTNADLEWADLANADLTEADLTGAKLINASLMRAKLYGVNLTTANLTRAIMTEANLADSNLTQAYLTKSDLTDANLIKTNLTQAYLTKSNLTRAVFRRANLTKADLTDVDLTDSRFQKSDLTGTKLIKTDLTVASKVEYCLFYNSRINGFQLQQLKQWKNCIPAKDVDIEHLRNNLNDESLWERHPETLSDEEVKKRLKLVVVDEDAPIPPPASDPETT